MLLVDENDDFLDGLASWLAATPGIEVIGKAHSGLEALERVERLTPDLVLMDVALPDLSGFEVTRRIKELRRAPAVLLMTFHGSRAAGVAAVAAGADGCVSKADVTDRLLPAVEELLWPARGPMAIDGRNGRWRSGGSRSGREERWSLETEKEQGDES